MPLVPEASPGGSGVWVVKQHSSRTRGRSYGNFPGRRSSQG